MTRRLSHKRALAAAKAWMESPEFAESINQADADREAGRCWEAGGHRGLRWRNGLNEPRKSWKADDPVQPRGWYHDGHRWRLKRDGGWFKDRSGFWRYNHPGQIGWLENPDGSWRYDEGAV